MTRVIDCPCGHQLMAANDQILLQRVREHITVVHPEKKHQTDAEIRATIAAAAYDPAQRLTGLVRRIFNELWNEGKLAVADEIFASSSVNHDPMNPELPPGPRGVRAMVEHYRTAFPDLHIEIGDMFAAGDRVSTGWTVSGTHRGALGAIAPTGKRVRVTGITIHRIENGKVAEVWANWDNLGFMQQLGVAGPVEHAEAVR